MPLLASIGAWFAKKLIFQRAGAAVKGIPARAWLYLAFAVALLIGAIVAVHAHRAAIKRVTDAAYAQGRSDEHAAQLVAQRAANAASSAINVKIRSKTDEEARHIARDADDLRLRGPGKAVCPGVAAPSRAASGHVEAAPQPGDPVGQVSDGGRPDLIAVPYADFVTIIEQHDQLLNEDRAWRESDTQQRALAEQSQPKEK